MPAMPYLLLMEMPPARPSWPYKDKVQHIIVFLVLTMSGGLAFQKKQIAVCLVLSGYGALMELLQSLLTVTRVASVYDWLADDVGIVIGLLVLYLLNRYILKLRKC